jgi:hypothetical protein
MITAETVNIATHGQIGKKDIFWVVAGHQFKRPYKIPHDPKTFKQRTQRNKFYVVSQMWGQLTPQQKEEWEEKVLKTQYTMTAYNLFMRVKMKESFPMIKTIQKGSEPVTEGANVVVINAVDVSKSTVTCNFFLTGDYNNNANQYGIYRVRFGSSTQIIINARDGATLGNLRADWTVIEYV